MVLARVLTRAYWIIGVPSLAIGLTACAAHHEADDDSNASSSDIYGGVKDDDAPAKRSVVALKIEDDELCSGALIAPNMVLTARHCVARLASESIACGDDGLSTQKQVTGDRKATDIAIYVGASPKFDPKADAYAKTVVSPDGDAICNSDIAVIILDRALTNIDPLSVRFSAPPRMGETIRAVGYGRNDAKLPSGVRFRKDNVPVLAIGEDGVTNTVTTTRLGPREFEVGSSVCDGDSGGPAISELTGAIVGVVSRGGACGQASGHIYTTTAGFDELFTRANQIAGDQAVAEQNTPPEAAAGAAPAPAGSTATAPSNTSEATSETGGCSSAPASPNSLAPYALLALALLARKRYSDRG